MLPTCTIPAAHTSYHTHKYVQLEGSSFVEGINEKFDATMTNIVRWREPSLAQKKEITSDTTIQVLHGGGALCVGGGEREGCMCVCVCGEKQTERQGMRIICADVDAFHRHTKHARCVHTCTHMLHTYI